MIYFAHSLSPPSKHNFPSRSSLFPPYLEIACADHFSWFLSAIASFDNPTDIRKEAGLSHSPLSLLAPNLSKMISRISSPRLCPHQIDSACFFFTFSVPLSFNHVTSSSTSRIPTVEIRFNFDPGLHCESELLIGGFVRVCD
jgi:hypothetical protein